MRVVSRLRPLCRLNKLGLYFGKEKFEALLSGDVSNAVVNRYFVHGLQAIGAHVCGTPEATPAMVRLQARYSQMAWETLFGVYKTNDHRLKAQALILLVHALIFAGFTIGAQLYLSKICKIIDETKLRFFPAYGRPAALSEQVREDAAVLSQAIFLDNYFHLTLSGSASLMTGRVEEEFRLDLEVRIIRWSFVVCSKWTQRSGLASVPTPVRYLSVDHADQRYPVGQGRHFTSEL